MARQLMTQVLRVECIEIKYHPNLSTLCHQVKNLYNRANFLTKKTLKNQNKILYYYDLNVLLKSEECYKVLPAHTAQQTLKVLCRNWKGYFQALKEWKKDSTLFFSMPLPPGYKSKKGEDIAIISNQQARIVNGWLVLPKKVGFYCKTRLAASSKLREVRIIPRRVGYTLEIVYLKTIPKMKKNPKRKGAIDLGITNLVTFVDNLGNQPIVVKDHGKGIKSVTQYYLKKQTQLRNNYVQQQRKQLKTKNKLQYGTSFYKLREKWRRKLKDAIHKLTHYLVKLCVERGIHEVIIGYNKKWKQGIHFWKKLTQMFVTIPYMRIINTLKYKAAEYGIAIELIPEDYTSKCSFLDNEFPQFRSNYVGRRIKRGLFRSAQGYLINADVNAAYNILVKSDPKAFPRRNVNGVGGYVMYPLRVSIEELSCPI
ncbi:MAG: IS200/IS605 family element transposase accessory protein TnpB [Candidatus Heimdallarchaeota archaeon]|nr:IS200/IS605 family element transposase accessory protein TnpB [Candidatus Heimdallarchaeota archaeon]